MGGGSRGRVSFDEGVPPREIAQYGNSIKKSVVRVLIIYKTGASKKFFQ